MAANSITDFASAGRAVLQFLHQRLGFDLWMVTRTEGEDWIVLQSEDHGYGVKPGTVFRWADSFCAEMVKGNGPRIAPDSAAIPAYAAAPIGNQITIKAYVGQPLVRADGSLFGTLCAIHPAVLPASVIAEQPLVELLGALLSSLLETELKATEESRRAERIENESTLDSMTHVHNRSSWDRLLALEEERCRRHGHPAAVLVIDLDELKLTNDRDGHAAGDALIMRAAFALRHAARSLDIVARLGGDEFGVLAVECDRAGGMELLERVRTALVSANVVASVGMAQREPSLGLQRAVERADQLMYENKKRR